MRKSVIAVNGSIHSRHAIRYAAEKYRHLQKTSFTLIHIQPTISQYLADEAKKTSGGKAKLEKLCEQNRLTGLALLSELKKLLISLGVSDGDVDCVTEARRHNVARDILDYAEKKNVCAVLVGRRGVSYVQELMLGSVTAELLTHSKLIPIWVVDNTVPSGHLLVAVDGSPGSLRAVDHVSFMQAGSKLEKIILLHITPTLSEFYPMEPAQQNEEMNAFIKKSDRHCTDDFNSRALNILQRAGFSEKDIEFQTIDSRWFVGKSIVEASKKLNAGTIVVGKSGSGEANHIGKIARYIINKSTNGAIWLVP
jgi:nucleotide-binding universal stress UspA family protein